MSHSVAILEPVSFTPKALELDTSRTRIFRFNGVINYPHSLDIDVCLTTTQGVGRDVGYGIVGLNYGYGYGMA